MDTLLSFICLLVLCAGVSVYWRVNSALAPLFVVSGMAVFLSATGVANMLVPAVWLLYGTAAGVAIALVKQKKMESVWQTLHTPGFYLFVGSAAVFLVYFAVRQPIFSSWDEFSFWGTASKLLKLNNSLYTTAEIGWPWTATQSPALLLIGYYAQFLGTAFSPWKVYWGYNIYMLACFAAVLSPFTVKQWKRAVPFSIVLLLTPYFFSVFTRLIYLDTSYISAYGDLPSGIIFGGVLAFYFALRHENKQPWFALVPLGAFALVKDNTFAIVLVAAGVMAIDTLLFYSSTTVKRWKKALVTMAIFAVPLLLYKGWRSHANWANAQNIVTQGESTSTPISEAIVQAVREMVGASPRSPRFEQALSGLWTAFLKVPLSMLGGSGITLLLVVFLLGVAVLLRNEKGFRRQTGVAGLLFIGGLLGYHFVLLVSYAFVYSNDISAGVPDYGRYAISYMAGFFVWALYMVSYASSKAELQITRQNKKTSILHISPWFVVASGSIVYFFILMKFIQDGDARKIWLHMAGVALFLIAILLLLWRQKGARALAGKTMGLFLACIMGFTFINRAPQELTMLGYPQRVFAAQQQFAVESQRILTEVDSGGRIFFVNQQDDGNRWFVYSYHLLPEILDYSITGGGHMQAPEKGSPSDKENGLITEQDLWQYLKDSSCEYIFIDQLDEDFIRSYHSLFSDKLKTDRDTFLLYRLNESGKYEPVALK